MRRMSATSLVCPTIRSSKSDGKLQFRAIPRNQRSQMDFSAFAVPPCASCGGVLKPDVVFYGENVPCDQVAAAQTHLEGADAILIVGSSLMVYSGFRFVRAAAQRQIPIAAINLGRTRADDLLTLKVEDRCEAALGFLLE